MRRMPHMAKICASPDDLLTTAEVAQLTRKNIATVNRWAASGQLPTAAQANGRVFRRADVDAFLEARRTGAAS